MEMMSLFKTRMSGLKHQIPQLTSASTSIPCWVRELGVGDGDASHTVGELEASTGVCGDLGLLVQDLDHGRGGGKRLLEVRGESKGVANHAGPSDGGAGNPGDMSPEFPPFVIDLT